MEMTQLISIGGEQEAKVETKRLAALYLKMLKSQFGSYKIIDPNEREILLREANEASRLMSLGIGTPFELTEHSATEIKKRLKDDFGQTMSQYQQSIEAEAGLSVDYPDVIKGQIDRGVLAREKLFGSKDAQIVFK